MGDPLHLAVKLNLDNFDLVYYSITKMIKYVFLNFFLSFELILWVTVNHHGVYLADILKVDFFSRSKLNFSYFAQEKVEKYH